MTDNEREEARHSARPRQHVNFHKLYAFAGPPATRRYLRSLSYADLTWWARYFRLHPTHGESSEDIIQRFIGKLDYDEVAGQVFFHSSYDQWLVERAAWHAKLEAKEAERAAMTHPSSSPRSFGTSPS